MVLLASKYDQSKFLKAADLTAEKKFKIKTVTEEGVGMGRDKETKLVVWFTNDKRGLVLNLTNLRTLRGPFGDDTESWVGKIIVVYPTTADFRGTMTPCLRVRIPPPKEANGGQTAAKPPTAPPAAVRPVESSDDFEDDDLVI
jgi:hypothetical protein